MRLPASFLASLAAFLVTASFAGCTGGPDARVSNAGLGTGAGVVAGGALGSQFGKGPGKIAATVAGVVAGGLIGNELGRRLDQRDRALAEAAEMDALERGASGRPLRWTNPETGRYGEIIPDRPYQREGHDCRDFTHTVYLDGRPEVVRGAACRNRDGTWSAIG